MEEYNFIEPIRDDLEAAMHEVCRIFTLIGTPNETPRYLNWGDFDHDTGVLTIESTQKEGICFEIQTPFDYLPCSEFWPQFKAFRTEFLQKYYPTINPY